MNRTALIEAGLVVGIVTTRVDEGVARLGGVPRVAESSRDAGDALLHLHRTTGHDVAGLSRRPNESEIWFGEDPAFDVVGQLRSPSGCWDICLERAP